MVESGRVPGIGSIVRVSKNCPDENRKSVQSVKVSTNGRIWASTRNISNPSEYRITVPSSTEKGSNQCEHRKILESGRLLGKGRIGPSIEKLSGRVPEKGLISVSTEKR